LGFFKVSIDMEKEKLKEKESGQVLPELPEPDWIIKEGFMTKRGASSSGFKKRWFVALNKKDQFVIKYYVDKKTADAAKAGTEKGQISCAGYKVKTEDAQNAIHLVPYDDERREWVMHCDSKEDQESWSSVFQNACWHAEAVGHPDPLIQGAFVEAFKGLKSEMGIYHYMPHDRAPGEMLTKLLVADLSREILPDIMSKINTPGGVGKSMTVRMIRKVLVAICSTACQVAWKAVDPAAQAAAELFKATVLPMLSTLVQKQEELKGAIADAAVSVAQPAIDKFNENVFAPLLSGVMGPTIEAIKGAIEGFETCTKNKLETIGDDKTKEGLISDVSYSYGDDAPMRRSYEVMQEIDNGKMKELGQVVPGLCLWRFTWYLDSSVRDLLRRAIFKAHQEVKNGMDSAAALATAKGELLHDCVLAVKDVIYYGLKWLISDLIDENLIQPCRELVKPIDEMIPEAMKQFLSIGDLLVETLDGLLDKVLEALAGETAKSAIAEHKLE
jgi:hypothetical protein